MKIPKITYGKESDELEQARELFDALRELDGGKKKKSGKSEKSDN